MEARIEDKDVDQVARELPNPEDWECDVYLHEMAVIADLVGPNERARSYEPSYATFEKKLVRLDEDLPKVLVWERNGRLYRDRQDVTKAQISAAGDWS